MPSSQYLAPPIPVAPGEPLPGRKAMREWLLPLSGRSSFRAIGLLMLDYSLLLLLLAGTFWLTAWWAKLLCGLVAGIVIGRLFIIGHDACHQSLTRHRRLNRWLGRIAFLPSLTPYSLWDLGHNKVHHGFTNLKGVDFVWAPLTLDEFNALTPAGRMLQRLYRSGWGPGAYYFVEMWWKKMMFPPASEPGSKRPPIFTLDCLLVTSFATAWIATLTAIGMATDQGAISALLYGFMLPILVWFNLMGFVIYGHHTHAKVSWHNDRVTWQRAQPFVSTTVHLTFPFQLGTVLHHIMEHTAHHVDMSIPLYRLKDAQAKLEQLLPGRIVVQPFSMRWYFETARACKLYDFSRNCWTDFEGHATSTPRPAPTMGQAAAQAQEVLPQPVIRPSSTTAQVAGQVTNPVTGS